MNGGLIRAILLARLAAPAAYATAMWTGALLGMLSAEVCDCEREGHRFRPGRCRLTLDDPHPPLPSDVMERRLTRSNERIVAGVCAGLAEFLGWSPTSIRALYVFVSIILAGLPGILVYLLLWWVMPERDDSGGFRLHDFRRQ